MKHDFSRLLRLARKTGDRLIVFNETSGDHFVIVSLDEYESMHDAAELLDLDDTAEFDDLDEEYADDEDNEDSEDYFDDSMFAESGFPQSPAFTPDENIESAEGIGWHTAGDVLKDIPTVAPPDFKYEFLGEETTAEPRPILHAEQETQGPVSGKPLDDDPIFFEEPVE